MKPFPFLLAAASLLSLASCTGHADEPQVVPAGKGSYASFPPAGADPNAFKTIDRKLYLMDTDKPIPTNHWWSNLLIDQYAGQLWAFPHQVKANADGIEVTFPTRWNDRGTDPVSEFPLGVRGKDFHPADSRAKSWSDWLVTFRMAENPDKYFDVTLGRGLPYVWVECKGVAPQLRASNETTFFDAAGKDLALPTATGALGISYGQRNFAVFAPEGTKFSKDGDTVSVGFAGAKSFLVICPLPARADIATFAKFADAIPRDSRLSWTYDPVKALVSTKWHLETEALRGPEKRLIQGWLPHNWRDTTGDVQLNGLEYLTPRGTMKCATGTDFTLNYAFNGFPPVLPAPKQTGLANDYDEARMRDYIARYATNDDRGGDTYWGGKKQTQWAAYMSMAKQVGDNASFETIKKKLEDSLADWLTYTPGEKERYFARYPRWKALVGFKSSYGSEAFNDQHFHYGYFTLAAGTVGLYDSQFLKDYGPMLRLVAKEYANWDHNDPDFPFLRTFDPWEGHSWAGGTSGGTGNNQESSSEAMQSWAGLYLLGTALGDKEMTATGAMGYAMESRAALEYWFNVHGDNWAPNYPHKMVGMVWSGGNNYGTYFSGDPAWIWGINWLPMSPAMAYLVQDPVYAKQSFGDMWDARVAKEGNMDLNKIGAGLGNVLLAQAAQVNPDWVAQQMDELWAANSAVAHDNDTPGVTYYLAQTNRTLGAIQWDTTLSLPLSRAYLNPRTKVATYMAFNPTDAPAVVQVFQKGKLIGTFRAAPRVLTVVNKLDAAK